MSFFDRLFRKPRKPEDKSLRPQPGVPIFWPTIEHSRKQSGGEQERQLDVLRAALRSFDDAQLLEFFHEYEKAQRKAYTWELWDAAYIIGGGTSDDAFAYFRDWLIAQGQMTFENALLDPESLVGIASPYNSTFEDFRYVKWDVWKERHDVDPPFILEPQTEPTGIELEEDEVGKRYPRLVEWVAGKK